MGQMAHSMRLLLLPALLQLPCPRARSLPMPQPAASPAKCAASSVDVETVNTGEKAGYDAVFEVTLRNRCPCAVHSVSLRSEGFASSVAVEPRLFRREVHDYIVGDGRRIEPAAAVRFRYAWDHAFRMAPAAVHDDCS